MYDYDVNENAYSSTKVSHKGVPSLFEEQFWTRYQSNAFFFGGVVEAFVALQIVEYNDIEYSKFNVLCALISIFNKQLAMYKAKELLLSCKTDLDNPFDAFETVFVG